MNTSPDFARNAALLDRRAAGLLTPEEEAGLRARAASDPELRHALAVDDAIEGAFAADRASIAPLSRELDPGLMERLVATGNVASNAASTTAVSLLGKGAQIVVGLGVVAAGFFGVRALVNRDATTETRLPAPVVQKVDHSTLTGMAASFARTLPMLPARTVALSSVDSNRERKVIARNTSDGEADRRSSTSTPEETQQRRAEHKEPIRVFEENSAVPKP